MMKKESNFVVVIDEVCNDDMLLFDESMVLSRTDEKQEEDDKINFSEFSESKEESVNEGGFKLSLEKFESLSLNPGIYTKYSAYAELYFDAESGVDLDSDYDVDSDHES
jgi:hypothetical protein